MLDNIGSGGNSNMFRLTVVLLSGNFPANVTISFTLKGFTNPSAGQGALTNVAAATTTASWQILDSGGSGTYPAIVLPAPGYTSTAPSAPSQNNLPAFNATAAVAAENDVERNWFLLSFRTKHLCSQQRLRSTQCLLKNASFSSGKVHFRLAHSHANFDFKFQLHVTSHLFCRHYFSVSRVDFAGVVCNTYFVFSVDVWVFSLLPSCHSFKRRFESLGYVRV
jgi:hypothetical protein